MTGLGEDLSLETGSVGEWQPWFKASAAFRIGHSGQHIEDGRDLYKLWDMLNKRERLCTSQCKNRRRSVIMTDGHKELPKSA